ncbi:MAG: permease, partial [Candidatus Latescibacterota bacterium]
MKRRSNTMLVPTLILAVLALVLLWTGYARHDGSHVEGARIGAKMIVEVLPLLVFAFLVAGMVQVLVPQETIYRWVGAGSGHRGILLGTIAGGLAPGGPYVSLPIAAGLFRAGAGTGTM